MRIKIIGESECARALRGLLRKAGFAVSEILPASIVTELPSGGYVVRVEEGPAEGHIYFDSMDSELERNILRHVTQLSPLPVTVDRPGGEVHSDREIRIVVPRDAEREAAAVEFGVLRGLMDTVSASGPPERWRGAARPSSWRAGSGGAGWFRKLFSP